MGARLFAVGTMAAALSLAAVPLAACSVSPSVQSGSADAVTLAVLSDVQALDAYETSLGAAVRTAVLAHEGERWGTGDVAVQSSVITAMFGGLADAEGTRSVEVYLVTTYGSFDLSSDGLTAEVLVRVPTVLTFDVSAAGAYSLTSYWVPEANAESDPAAAESEVRARFAALPSDVVDEVVDLDGYALFEEQLCYARAIVAAGLDGEQAANRLLGNFLAQPASSLHDELLCYGSYALEAAVDRLLDTSSSMTDDQADLLFGLVEDLVPGEVDGLAGSCPRERFASWLARSESLLDAYGATYLEECLPGSYLLLERAQLV